MSKAVKSVIGIVAAIAIPFAAPAIASAIGLSTAVSGALGASAAVGSTVGGALTGAALGATRSAVLGEDIGRGALMGGVGGGIGGYLYTPTPTPTSALTGGEFTAAGAAGAGPGSYLGGTQGSYLGTGLSEVSGAPVTLANAGTAGLNMAAAPAGFNVPGALAQAPAAGGTFTQAVKELPGAVAAKFSDPKALADMALRGTGMLIGSAAAGSGLTDEEQALLQQQEADLRTAQAANADLYRQKLEEAQALAGESRYFDPAYFGLQSARRAQLAGAQAKRENTRGLTGGRRQAEERRYDLAIGRNTGTAYDVGFGTGVQGRLQTRQAGLSAMPREYPSYDNAYANLRSGYAAGATRRRDIAGDVGDLFGAITGPNTAQRRG
jgi:hypothetical protein